MCQDRQSLSNQVAQRLFIHTIYINTQYSNVRYHEAIDYLPVYASKCSKKSFPPFSVIK